MCHSIAQACPYRHSIPSLDTVAPYHYHTVPLNHRSIRALCDSAGRSFRWRGTRPDISVRQTTRRHKREHVPDAATSLGAPSRSHADGLTGGFNAGDLQKKKRGGGENKMHCTSARRRHTQTNLMLHTNVKFEKDTLAMWMSRRQKSGLQRKKHIYNG